MTREEAIYNLKALLTMGDFRDAYGDSICAEPYHEAVDMAIEALKNSERTAESSQNVSNGDLISRKAAIDALKEYFSDEDRTDTEYGAYWHHKHVLDVLGKLPSAQPEIIRCNDCKWLGEQGLCGKWDQYISNGDFYCGCAERETDE